MSQPYIQPEVQNHLAIASQWGENGQSKTQSLIEDLPMQSFVSENNQPL